MIGCMWIFAGMPLPGMLPRLASGRPGGGVTHRIRPRGANHRRLVRAAAAAGRVWRQAPFRTPTVEFPFLRRLTLAEGAALRGAF